MSCDVDERIGKRQSPVDISGYVDGGEPRLSFEYEGEAVYLENTG